MYNIIKRTISLTLISVLTISSVFMFFEPQLVKSAEDSVDVSLTVTAEISISSPANVTLLPNMPGITGGTATGECTWTVVTTNNAGFTMTLKESDAGPALVGQAEGDSFADYTPTNSGTPDYTWAIADSTAEFGFTVEPATAADTVQLFLDNGADTCDISGGSNTVNACWFGFNGTTAITVINRSTETDYDGEDELVKFKAQLYNADGVPNDANGILVEDSYQATITATATSN